MRFAQKRVRRIWLQRIFVVGRIYKEGGDYQAGQAGIACPTLSRRVQSCFVAAGFSRGVPDADHGGSRAHPRDDHDDQI